MKKKSKRSRRNPWALPDDHAFASIDIHAYDPDDEKAPDVMLYVRSDRAFVSLLTHQYHDFKEMPVVNGIVQIPTEGVSLHDYLYAQEALNSVMPLLVKKARDVAAKLGVKLHMFKRNQTKFTE